MKTFRGIGLMSGTSLDGLDLAYCSFSENSDGSWNYEFLETETVSYSKEWRDRLATVQTASAEVYAQTDSEYGELLGSILNDLDRKSTRLNSSHVAISYAVFCLKKKKL